MAFDILKINRLDLYFVWKHHSTETHVLNPFMLNFRMQFEYRTTGKRCELNIPMSVQVIDELPHAWQKLRRKQIVRALNVLVLGRCE